MKLLNRVFDFLADLLFPPSAVRQRAIALLAEMELRDAAPKTLREQQESEFVWYAEHEGEEAGRLLRQAQRMEAEYLAYAEMGRSSVSAFGNEHA